MSYHTYKSLHDKSTTSSHHLTNLSLWLCLRMAPSNGHVKKDRGDFPELSDNQYIYILYLNNIYLQNKFETSK